MTRRPRAALLPWETIERRLVLDRSPWFRLFSDRVRLPDGRTLPEFHRLEKPDVVVVFALTAEGRVVGLWHYKHGPGRIIFALPAGHVDPGEDPEAAARRELHEETGYEARSWKVLGRFTIDGNLAVGRVHIYLARHLRRASPIESDDLEDFDLEEVTPRTLERRLADGSVATMIAAAAIVLGLRALPRPRRLRTRPGRRARPGRPPAS